MCCQHSRSAREADRRAPCARFPETLRAQHYHGASITTNNCNLLHISTCGFFGERSSCRLFVNNESGLDRSAALTFRFRRLLITLAPRPLSGRADHRHLGMRDSEIARRRRGSPALSGRECQWPPRQTITSAQTAGTIRPDRSHGSAAGDRRHPCAHRATAGNQNQDCGSPAFSCPHR